MSGALKFVSEFVQSSDVLNIGCWTGDFEQRAAELTRIMTSIDVESRALEVARRNVPTAEFIEASVLDIPFSDQYFDLVTMWAVIEHIPTGTEPRALAEIARVLRRDGRLALSTPSSYFRSRIFDPAYMLAGHRHYSPLQISRLLEEAGFCVERIRVLGGWYDILSVFVFYIWKHLFHKVPSWKYLAKRIERDRESEGFNTLYVLARRV